MVAIKNAQVAFAVRVNGNAGLLNALGKQRFAQFISNVQKHFPFVSIEGLNREARSNKTYKPLLEVGPLALCEVKKEKRELICVGVSDKFDISLEKESDIILGGVCPRIPVYDLSNPLDVAKISRALANYFEQVYPLQSSIAVAAANGFNCTARPQPQNVTFHANFVKVGNQCVSRDSFFASLSRPKSTVKVTEKVTLDGFDPLGLVARFAVRK